MVQVSLLNSCFRSHWAVVGDGEIRLYTNSISARRNPSDPILGIPFNELFALKKKNTRESVNKSPTRVNPKLEKLEKNKFELILRQPLEVYVANPRIWPNDILGENCILLTHSNLARSVEIVDIIEHGTSTNSMTDRSMPDPDLSS